MKWFYVIVGYAEDDYVVFSCKTKREAISLATSKRQLFPDAEIVITKAIYSELKVKVNTLD